MKFAQSIATAVAAEIAKLMGKPQKAEDTAEDGAITQELRDFIKAEFDAVLTASQTELTELRATISRQEQEISGLKDAAAKADAEHKAALEAKEADLEKRATQKAQDFCAAQGIGISQLPATSAGDNSKNQSLEDVRSKMASETDPVKLAELARKARELRGDGDLLEPTDEE